LRSFLREATEYALPRPDSYREIALKLFDQAGFFRPPSFRPASSGPAPLIERLRSATHKDQARLDAALAALDLSSPSDYCRFLRFHLVARTGVEKWLRDHAPAGLRPPEQTPLIAHDMAALGEFPPGSAPAFAGATGEGWLGAAYAVAAAHIGNQADLGQVDADNLPSAFVGDIAMGAYWQRLQLLLEEGSAKAAAADVLNTARAAFGHFAGVAATTGAVLPA
jgi:heme oxygenase